MLINCLLLLQSKTKTMKLKLNKNGVSSYSNRVGDILISVYKQYITGEWVGIIETYTHTAKDFNNNEVEIFNELFIWKTNTKKDTCSALVEYIKNN